MTHDWIFAVLADLRRHALRHDLTDLGTALEIAMIQASAPPVTQGKGHARPDVFGTRDLDQCAETHAFERR